MIMAPLLNEVMNALVEILGESNVSNLKEDLIAYSLDMSSEMKGKYTLPDLVCIPNNVSQIQQIVRLANKHNISITARAASSNNMGTALARNGGIVLDLKRMDGVEINPETKTAIVETGTTWARAAKAAKKHGLKVPVASSHYAGSVIGNYCSYNISFYNARYCFLDRVLSIEAVLPTGELIRTGSAAYLGHETTYPSFRYAYGPDLTGLFRGSLGTLGIITKAAYRLLPVKEYEVHVDIGFDCLDSLCKAIGEIESYDLTSYMVAICKRMAASILTPAVEWLDDAKKLHELEAMFSEYNLFVGIEGVKKQVDLYIEIIREVAQKHRGRSIALSNRVKENLDDFLPGGGIRVTRMLRNQSIGIISILPLDKVPLVHKRSTELARAYDIYDPATGDSLILPLWIIPYNRGADVYIEQDIPTGGQDLRKILGFYRELRYVIEREYSASSMALFPTLESRLIPAYIGLLRGIKGLVDPNGIMGPGKLITL